MAKDIKEIKEQPEEKKSEVEKSEPKCSCGCGCVPPLKTK